MLVSLSGVSLSYEDSTEVLHDFTFHEDVRSLAVIGRSGCGKTTLLRVLGGLLVPQQGTVQVGERMLGRDEGSLLAYRRSIGYVFQQGGLFLHMNALDNIARPLELVHNYTRAQARETAEQLLSRFGLIDQGHKYPRELSGGQYQRIAIARAIAPKARLLLLDEPTSALDPAYTGEVLRMVEELKESGTRFIIVTNRKVFLRGAGKISIVLETEHESGALYRVLSHFIYNDLNMTKIESRPIRDRSFEYRFFIDFAGNLQDGAVRNALRGLRDEAKNLKVLGNY